MSIDTIAPLRPYYDRDTVDPIAAALGHYIDSHDRPGTDEFALHTLVGLASVDRELLQSSAGTSAIALAVKREAIYTLACERLASSSSRAIAEAIDQITSVISSDTDLSSAQIVATLQAIRPSNPPTAGPDAIEKSGATVIELSSFRPSKRLVKGLVATAMTAGLVAGVAPHAAAETLPPADDTRATDTETTNQSDIAGFLNTFGSTESDDVQAQTTEVPTSETSTFPADTVNIPATPSTQEDAPLDTSIAPDSADTTESQQNQTTETPTEQPKDVGSPIEEGLSDIFGGTTASEQESDAATVTPDPEAIPSAAIREQAANDLTHAINVGNEKKLDKTVESIEEDLGTIGLLFTILDVVDHPRVDDQQEPVEEEPTNPEQSDGKNKNKDDDKDNEPGSNEADKKDKESASKYDKLLDVIASWESGGNYNAYFGHGNNHEIKFTSMTVGEVLKWQREYLDGGSPSSAMGKYQVLFRTLSSLVENYDSISKDQIFDENLQDKIAMILLKQRGLNDYLEGKISDREFAHNLSKEWASLPSVTGKHPNASYYDGDGLNKSHVKVATILKAVRSIKAKPAEKAKRNDHNTSNACPDGTEQVKGITEGWTRSGHKKKITLCSIPGTAVINSSATPHWKNKGYDGTTANGVSQIAVNKNVAKDALAMAKAAKGDGITLTATIGYRSLEEQCSIYIRNHSRPARCPSWITKVSGNWTTDVVFSDHMDGHAIDFYGSSIDWMKRNGPKFDYIDTVFRAGKGDQAHFAHK